MLQYPEFKDASICQSNENGMIIGIPKGENGFIRDTKWSVEIKKNQLRVWASVF